MHRIFNGLRNLGCQGRDELEDIGHHENVGHLADGGVLVLVDGQDEVGLFHAGQVLDGAGDAAGDIELGRNGLAGGADLVVVGQTSPGAAEGSAAVHPESLIFGSGRPVLVVPHSGPVEVIGERVLVAWNGSREAARAVADAACTVIDSFFESSPEPSSLTSLRTERIRPFAFSDSGVTCSPASKRVSPRRFFTRTPSEFSIASVT